MQYDLILSNAQVFFENQFSQLHIAIKDSKIAKISSSTIKEASLENIDCTGLHILPGVIDSQVHFREPGNEHKENLETGSKAALLGGVTAFFDMPNTNPATTNAENAQYKLDRAAESSYVDYAFYIGATQENLEELEELTKIPGVIGTKIFMGSSTGNLLLYDEKHIEKVLLNTTKTVAVHCEDEDRMLARKHLAEAAAHPSAHPVWRDDMAAFLASSKLLQIARKLQRKVHILHITTKQEMDFLSQYKDFCSLEVTPQHLSLSAPECYEKLGSFAQMNPPIRGMEHQKALWQAINNGSVTVMGSDHAPHTIEEKEKPYPNSPSGMPGVQTILPLMLNHVNRGNLKLERLVELLCIEPLRLFNIQNRNPIIENGDASFTIVDLNKEKTICEDWLASKCQWSPFTGTVVKGFPTGVVLHGKLCMWEEEILASSMGQVILNR